MRKSDISFLRFDGGGLFSSSGPWIHSHRMIQSYELIVAVRGEVHLYEGEQKFDLKPGDYLVLHIRVSRTAALHGARRQWSFTGCTSFLRSKTAYKRRRSWKNGFALHAADR